MATSQGPTILWSPMVIVEAAGGALPQVSQYSVKPANQEEGCVSFEDVAVYFSWEEWTLLDDSQRLLYQTVMTEIFTLVSSLRLELSGIQDLTQAESCGDLSVPALRFLTPCLWTGCWIKVESESPIEQSLSAEGGVSLSTLQQQMLCCAETPLLSTDNVTILQTSSSLLRHQVTSSGRDAPTNTESGEAIQNEKKNCKCTYCGKIFTSISHLNRHWKIHTGEKPFQCSECGKSFSQKAFLIKHFRMHTGEKPYRCGECGKAFKHNISLISHQGLHTGEMPFKCTECGKSYRSREGLKVHYRFHTGEMPFECSECGKSYRSREGLLNHFYSHTAEKPFSCGECGMYFTQNSELIEHLTVHGKPFKCNECGRVFNSSYNFVRHMKVHVVAKQYACRECDKVYCSSSSLYKHRKIHAR
ncbi:similar to 5730403M16Rik protein [Rattus norvegicus]|uniref:Zinc finger protein 954 n=3 Tax=Rattus norvegicus TaxID=10116 RepID=D4A7C1_RAT|nr:zinc finger protein 419 [Rattus norvegicus]EDL83198.1 similar to 5730403M16Rik protein [Rattus norvegicus]|eukprot:NP_001100942.1 zinc finger protein 419 [Rattus norvegicus]